MSRHERFVLGESETEPGAVVVMSDASGRPGWWQASDGKWYPPSVAPGLPPPPPPLPPKPGKDRWSRLGGWGKAGVIGATVLLFILALGAVGAVVDTSDDKPVSTEATIGVATTAKAATTTTTTTTTTVDRAALKAEYDAEVAQSCARAVEVPPQIEDSAAAKQQQIFWERRWAPIASQDRFVADVAACASPQREERALSQCTAEVSVELLSRDADEFKNQCYVLVFRIIQFDQNTGPCTFRASFDVAAREYSFEYKGDNSLVTFKSPCPQLNPLGQDDVLRLHVKVLRAEEYSTVIGGQTSAVSFSGLTSPEILQDN